jgi:hypothetical protein
MVRQGGLVGPLGAAIDTLVGLSYISDPTIVSITTMCVNGNTLAKILTFQSQQEKHND